MFKKLLGLLLVGTAMALPAYDESEWKVRPWEIIKGLKPQGKTIWQLDKDSLDGWKVTGAGAELSTTDITKLWGEKVVKMTFPKGGQATIRPPKPLEIKEPADGIEVWVYGPVNNTVGSAPTLTMLVSDAAGKKYRLPTAGSGSRWNRMRWWGVSAAQLPKGIKFPVKLESMTFSKLLTTTKDDFLCFDMIGAFKVRKIAVPDTKKMNLPFPTTPDTIMPTSMKEGAKNFARQEGKKYVFGYEGKDAKVVYTYEPKTGTLSDITASFNGGDAFQIADKGGIHAMVDGVKITPATEGVEAKLAYQGMKDGKLKTIWNLSLNGKNVKYTLLLSIKGKSLIAEVSSDDLTITAFDAGEYKNIKKPNVFGLTYLHNRWDYTRFLATPDFIASTLVDWYNSEASELEESRARGGLSKAYAGENSARIMGGTIYGVKTNGKRNALKERLFFTIAPELEEVMPNIANPVSPYRTEMSQRVCHTRSYSLQGLDRHVDDEIEMWTRMRDYGATDMFVRYHSGQLRTPLENNRFSLSMDAAMSNGGDANLIRLVKSLRQVMPRVGVYQDNRVIAANDPVFEYGLVGKMSDNSFMVGWDGCFRPKPALMLGLYDKFLPEFLKKYPYNAEYLDELSNAPPWADVDFDADVPGAGTFAETFRAWGATAIKSREHFKGPIWSEGCAAYFWAGLCDVDYAVSNDYNPGLPLIVDFKLRKINPLETYTGADWPEIHNTDGHFVLATMIAKGNIAHLSKTPKPNPNDPGMPWQGRAMYFPESGWQWILKTYFMMRQLQELYFASPVETIKYESDGELLTASEMVKQGKTFNGRIYQKYANGLEIYVNRGKEGDWTVNLDGEEFVLPVNGHAAMMPDTLLQYSALKDGRRVDYSRGPLYTYMDGLGEMTEFPEMTVANAYLMRQVDGKTRITPVPFMAAETIKGLSFNKATPLKRDGSKLADTFSLDVTDAGMGDLNVDGKAFHYTME